MKIRKNPDKSITDELDVYFKENDICPCRVDNIKCMCQDFKNQEDGLCDCLYFEKINE